MRNRILIPSFGLCYLLACITAQADWVFVDGTFANTEWSGDVIVYTTSGHDGFGQQTLTGNPAPCLENSLGIKGPGGLIITSHFSNSALYNPAVEGAITEVRFSLDVIQTFTTGALLGVDLLLFQNDTYYARTAGPDLTNSSVWGTLSHSGLVADDFSNILPNGLFGSQHPVFSDQGSMIQFGFLTSIQSNHADDVAGYMDNFGVVVVPEPSGEALIAYGAIGIIAYRFGKSFSSRNRAELSHCPSPRAGKEIA
ncbi:MAG: hypothetical protein ABI925_00275 [Verrucomicrobiota bacterium]